MSTSSPSAVARPRRFALVRALAGGVVILFLLASLVTTASEMGGEGTMWMFVAAASGLLLLVASWRNWPLLWNPLGRILRALVGETMARVAFGAMALVFVASALLAWR
ncbi:MAG: hypothetical protein IPN47_17330 [Gemmatimonadetes bacterium]|nr:hypothetical protein [Gemmatimonadota bacterium]MBK9409768.1 hypothetical protein [Gemmatimonadota bacterium]MBK9977150.1 hypothetical protein [Gemmatimonadota bacterium]